MEQSRNTRISYAALAGGLVVASQMGFIVLRGEALCLNEGCKVVEQLTTISPLAFNLLGLAYFLTVAMLFRLEGFIIFVGRLELGRVALLAGLAVEGVLLAYQIFAVRTFCSYCLVIFAIVFFLNILAGLKQMVAGVVVLAAINCIFPLLSFGTPLLLARNQTLDAGTYGKKNCSAPAKELYLIFSANCPHCRDVLDALASCNSCDFHFNPIEPIESLDLPGLERTASYYPDINRVLLALLGIDAVPVLLVKNADGFSFIKGEKSILAYIKQACFLPPPILYQDSSAYSKPKESTVQGEEEGECSVQVDCPPPK